LIKAKVQQFLARTQEHGVLMGTMGNGIIRAVTHYGIEAQHISQALTGIKQALADI
jgi:threonine aldolase